MTPGCLRDIRPKNFLFGLNFRSSYLVSYFGPKARDLFSSRPLGSQGWSTLGARCLRKVGTRVKDTHTAVVNDQVLTPFHLDPDLNSREDMTAYGKKRGRFVILPVLLRAFGDTALKS